MKKVSIYMAGNIQKDHEKESEIYWTARDMEVLAENCFPLEVTFLNPATRSDDVSDQKSVFGRDMTQVFLSDIVLVDARQRRGLGVGAEMMWAKMHDHTVITLAPFGSHYRRESCTLLGQTVENWTHPFIESLSDCIVLDLKEAADAIKLHSTNKCKGRNYIQKAMQHYQETQYAKDKPMQDLILNEKYLVDRFQKIKEQEIFSL